MNNIKKNVLECAKHVWLTIEILLKENLQETRLNERNQLHIWFFSIDWKMEQFFSQLMPNGGTSFVLSSK